ncbi:hypothetical protein [Micromonospora sp. NPDC007230]|uniref:hypothetical protein n=1 Tax=Micromonospora sp. NPDC007230 TaxID=3364237 RepID=UPI0036BA4FCB
MPFDLPVQQREERIDVSEVRCCLLRTSMQVIQGAADLVLGVIWDRNGRLGRRLPCSPQVEQPAAAQQPYPGL